jgi:hypothetical protein
MPGTPIHPPYCPKCRSIMSLLRVAASPSVDYEAHTLECAHCRFRYIARIEMPLGIRTLHLEHIWNHHQLAAAPNVPSRNRRIESH